MANSKHVFVQLDTDSIIAGYEELLFLAKEKPKNIKKKDLIKLTKMHTLLFMQGSMAMGNPTKDFTIDVDVKADVYFSILPLELFSYHHLYFTSFKCNDRTPNTIPSLSVNNPHVSFKITCEKAEETGFTLGIQLKYEDFKGKEQSINLILDPKLKIRQTAG